MYSREKITLETAELNSLNVLPRQGLVLVQMASFDTAEATEPLSGSHIMQERKLSEMPSKLKADLLAWASGEVEADLAEAEADAAKSEEVLKAEMESEDEDAKKRRAQRQELAAKLAGFEKAGK